MVPGSEAAVCQSIYPGRHPHSAGAHHAARARSTATCSTSCCSTRARPTSASATSTRSSRRTGRRAQRAGALRALWRRRDRGDDRGLPRLHREALRRGDRTACRPDVYEAEDYLDGDDRRQRRRRSGSALTVGRGRLDFDFAGIGRADRLRAQHPVSRAARHHLHASRRACSIPEVPANAGYYRTIRDERAARGRVVRARAAGGDRLPSRFRRACSAT